jgi:peptidoglycan/xylan/chitin deacetylase (PgdA/CDA1 family)
MWQVKWFRIAVIVISGLVAVGLAFVVIFIHERSFSQSPTPVSNSATPLPSPQGKLPEPKALGVATKDESDTAILMYHHIQDVPNNANSTEKNLSLSPAKFKEEIKYLSDSGYKTAILSELFNDVPEKRVILTFDDGYKDLMTNAFPTLKVYGFRGVTFIIVDDVGKPGYVTWDDLKLLKNEGWEIGSHSLTHLDLEVSSNDTSQKQIIDSKKILEDELGIKVEFFCYPAGKYNLNTISILKAAGYRGAVTINSGIKNYQDKIFELKRLRIVNTESLASFKSKVYPVK